MKTLGILAAMTLALASFADEKAIADKIGVDVLATTRTSDLKHFDHATGVRVGYDLSKRIGAVLEVDGSDFKGSVVENAFAGVKLTFPTGRVSPYLIGGFGMKFPDKEEYLAGGLGLSVAITEKVSVFSEALGEKSKRTSTTARFSVGVGYRF